MDKQKGERAFLECKIEARLFRKEAKQLKMIVKYAKITNEKGEPEAKFKSDSHAIRAFVMRGIRYELDLLSNTRGRPRK